MRRFCVSVLILLPSLILGMGSEVPFSVWTMEEAVGLLNDSPWAKQSTFTTVIGGVGSGILGEKEIYSTFYTRLLSALPIREAFARVQQINHDYDSLTPEEKKEFDKLLQPGLEIDVDHWIVIALSFRSNNPDLETRIDRYLRTSSVQSLRVSALLSTNSHPRVELAAYYPAKGDGTGAKFVFPRTQEGSPVVQAEDPALTFELDVPGDPDLSISFPTKDMFRDGELIL